MKTLEVFGNDQDIENLKKYLAKKRIQYRETYQQ